MALKNDFFIVGVGASAGGLAAFESFFSGMPTEDTNMAFVLIQHLAPDHKSILTELVQRYTKMKVFEVQDGMKIEVNCTYIIPPNYDMALLNGNFQLFEQQKTNGCRLPIDFFFNSLALDQHDRSIGIVLSGTGHDGTEGIKAIKKEGGTVIVQSIDSAEFTGMPQSAIDTGLVDYILSAEEIAKELIQHINLIDNTDEKTTSITADTNTLNKIFILLRKQTTHDFSQYKSNTIGRRIERRMIVHQIKSLEEYYKYLSQTKNEINLLFSELLIGVTNFFRDTEAFTMLQEKIIPKLFLNELDDSTIRVWVTSCSTGEEAYSIAILLMEHMESLKENFAIQIFATDINPEAIAKARMGIYPESISNHVSSKRLKQFFIKNKDDNTYRIQKSIRDLLVFSVHDIIKDPPFSKMDLITCRNLLIYLNVELQQKLISLFHYSLNNDGTLFLGSSESIGESTNLFDVIDQKSKLFRCKKDSLNTKQTIMNRLIPAKGQIITPQHLPNISIKEKLPLKELTEKAILEQIAPAAALINQEGDILYLHGRTGMYLELPSGETNTNNILKMAKDGLANDLVIAFHKAKRSNEIIQIKGICVNDNGHFLMLNLTIRPIIRREAFPKEQQLYLVILEDAPLGEECGNRNISLPDKNKLDENEKIKSLKQELLLQKEFLQEANNKLEISNEELKSYNEEIQSMNEELQSTNEELETSKEELQSVNEELSTVNSELNAKVNDLSQSNNDINNLLSGTGTGTIFVDLKLCILRFTPASTRMVNLIMSDLGRPVGHIVSNLIDYNNLVVDTQNVLDTLIPKEIEVKTKDDKWYLMRIQPYRTVENVIEGAVISFVDISNIIAIREELKKANSFSRLAAVIHDSNDAVTVYDMEGKIIAWNPGAVKLYGWSECEALKLNIKDRIPKELQEDDISKLKLLSDSKILETYKTKRLNKNGDILDVYITSSALVDKDGIIYAISTTERNKEEKYTYE